MKDQNENQIRRILRRLISKSEAAITRAACPDEETLANYLGGHLAEAVKAPIEAHLAQCSFCMEEVAAAFKAEQLPMTETVPERLVNRAMNLVPEPRRESNVLDLVIRVVKDSLELVRTTGEWISPLTLAPIGVRGRPQPSENSILQVEKQMGDFKVGIEVERVESGICQVAVSVAGQGGTPADNLRVSLLSGGREQASYLTKNGEAVFERIPQGAYDLQISDSGAPVGVVRLAME